MLIALFVLSLGIAGWVAGAYYERNTPADSKGWAALPGCVVTIMGLVWLLWSLKWWLGVALLALVAYSVYRLIVADKK